MGTKQFLVFAEIHIDLGFRADRRLNPKFVRDFSYTLISCAHEIESVDGQVERELAEFHTSCLSPARPTYSRAHTDCVLSRYQERQRELERLRNAVAPVPKAAAEAPQAAPAPELGPQPDWMM